MIKLGKIVVRMAKNRWEENGVLGALGILWGPFPYQRGMLRILGLRRRSALCVVGVIDVVYVVRYVHYIYYHSALCARSVNKLDKYIFSIGTINSTVVRK